MNKKATSQTISNFEHSIIQLCKKKLVLMDEIREINKTIDFLEEQKKSLEI